MAITLEQIDAELLAGRRRRQTKPEQESFMDALSRAPVLLDDGRWWRSLSWGLLADPVGDLVEYATGTPMMPTRDAALVI